MRAGHPEDAEAFLSPDVVEAYRHRPPYPNAVISHLRALMAAGANAAVELGCGTGEISRRLARYVERIDAVDPSAAMLAAATAAPGGDARNISWTCSRAEEFIFRGPYGIAIAAESFHWMDAAAVMRRLAPELDEAAHLVLIGRGESAPWGDAFRAMIPRYSVIRDYRAVDVPAELSGAGLWEIEDRLTMPEQPFRQSVDDYIELQHSRSAFARHRMDAAAVEEFDNALRVMLAPFVDGGYVVYDTSVSLAWGRPTRALRDTLTS